MAVRKTGSEGAIVILRANGVVDWELGKGQLALDGQELTWKEGTFVRSCCATIPGGHVNVGGGNIDGSSMCHVDMEHESDFLLSMFHSNAKLFQTAFGGLKNMNPRESDKSEAITMLELNLCVPFGKQIAALPVVFVKSTYDNQVLDFSDPLELKQILERMHLWGEPEGHALGMSTSASLSSMMLGNGPPGAISGLDDDPFHQIEASQVYLQFLGKKGKTNFLKARKTAAKRLRKSISGSNAGSLMGDGKPGTSPPFGSSVAAMDLLGSTGGGGRGGKPATKASTGRKGAGGGKGKKRSNLDDDFEATASSDEEDPSVSGRRGGRTKGSRKRNDDEGDELDDDTKIDEAFDIPEDIDEDDIPQGDEFDEEMEEESDHDYADEEEEDEEEEEEEEEEDEEEDEEDEEDEEEDFNDDDEEEEEEETIYDEDDDDDDENEGDEDKDIRDEDSRADMDDNAENQPVKQKSTGKKRTSKDLAETSKAKSSSTPTPKKTRKGSSSTESKSKPSAKGKPSQQGKVSSSATAQPKKTAPKNPKGGKR